LIWMDESGTPLLHKLVEKNKTTSLQLLVLNGAKVETVDSQGQTAIHFAAKLGQSDCLAILLAQPTADISVKDKEGNVALDLAKKANVRREKDSLLY